MAGVGYLYDIIRVCDAHFLWSLMCNRFSLRMRVRDGLTSRIIYCWIILHVSQSCHSIRLAFALEVLGL